MCGRFAQHTNPRYYERLLRARAPGMELPPRFNIAPGAALLACRTGADGARELAYLHWGLVPHWAQERDAGYSMINARAETVAQKPAYRAPLRQRRCLIAADGFFEWQAGRPRKQPYFIRRRDAAPFMFAGLWDRWHGSEPALESCTIVVAAASGALAAVHQRMPVVLPSHVYDAWLDPQQHDATALCALLSPATDAEFEAYPVSTRVNRAANDGPELLERYQPRARPR